MKPNFVRIAGRVHPVTDIVTVLNENGSGENQYDITFADGHTERFDIEDVKFADIRPTAILVGEDGNIFNIMARVTKVLKLAGWKEEAEEYVRRVTTCTSYDKALVITMEYVEVE